MYPLTSTVTARPHLVVAMCCWGAPRIPALLEDDRTHFFPKNMLSQQAMALLQQEFPDAACASRCVVVFSNDHGLVDTDRLMIKLAATSLEEKSEVMVGAFGSMASGSPVLMKEFAIALALGILIDTFVIRPMLLPATLFLLERRKRVGA